MDPLEAINEAIALHAGWLGEARLKGNAEAPIQRWTLRMEALQEASEELKRLRAWSKPAPISYGDLSDLPQELIAELSGGKADELEEQIYRLVKAAGEIGLDALLIELYRRHGGAYARKFLNNKCYRMVQKGLIHQVPSRRGFYSVLE